MSEKKTSKADLILRIIGIGTALVVAIAGSYCFKICQTNAPRDYISQFVVCLAGSLLVVAEVGHWLKKSETFKKLLTRFLYFLYFRTGRGITFVITGTLMFTNYLMSFIGVIAIAVGLMNLLAAMFLRQKKNKEQQQSLQMGTVAENSGQMNPNQAYAVPDGGPKSSRTSV